MGMSASQARFLGLTARKTNVEYEGQQINQQRTALSNTTANYYNDLLGMSVPVPPSVEDYTKTVYSFVDGSLTNSITSMIAKGDGMYKISYTSNWVDDFSVVSAASTIVTRLENSQQTNFVNNQDAITSGIKRNGTSPNFSYTYNGNQLHYVDYTVAADIPDELKGLDPAEYYYYEEKTSGGSVTHYLKKSDVDSANYAAKQNAAITTGIRRNGTNPNYSYSYGSHYLTEVTFDENNKAPEGIGNGTYLKYTDKDGNDQYLLKSNVVNSTYDDNGRMTSGSVINYTDDRMMANKNINVLDKTENYEYMVGSRTFRELGSKIDAKLLETDEYYKTLSEDQIDKLLAEEVLQIGILNDRYGSDSKWQVRYVKNTSANTWEPYFTKLSTLAEAIYSDTDTSLSNIPMYKIGSAKKNEEIKNVDARFEQDSTGRIINVTLRPGEIDEVTYAVSTETMTDQAKYDDAMNQYEYDKAKYDQSIQEINSKIEIIQAEDKNLELRLKQLDTEQEAIQTEMEAVQQVINKNVESTFKTFG